MYYLDITTDAMYGCFMVVSHLAYALGKYIIKKLRCERITRTAVLTDAMDCGDGGLLMFTAVTVDC